MPGFNIYHSNRSEILLTELAHVVSSPPLLPFQKEIIVVQSKGMERWLIQQLSARFGVWANSVFPFPNAMIQELFVAALGDFPVENPFSPELLAWRIHRLLPAYLHRSGFESLKQYAESDLKLAQLCYRVADVFDQYTIHRPEMLLRWEQGEESHWQAHLWRALVAETQVGHRAAVRKRFFEKLREISVAPTRFPARLSIFGISALPAFHLDIFAGISRLIDVHLFLMSPTREFWADIVSEKQQARRRQRERRQMQLAFPANPYFETGHPLLASLGKRGRDFTAMILDRDEGQEWSRYKDPGEETLLACLQSDILNLRHRGRDGFRKAVSTSDTSLQVHSCHSPMREMEVLHDQLLALFDAHAELQPHDIVVMAPDISAYASYISAVFSGEQPNQRRIPFSISDQTAAGNNPVARAFFKLLEIAGGRLQAPAVMDLLDIPFVQRRFGIRPEERSVLRRWVEETRIAWGIDGADRARLGVEAFEENSWKAGLERLLLGYALPSEGDRLFGGILPFNDVEGSGQTLGRFLEFAGALFRVARDLRRPRTLSEWSKCLLEWMNQFLDADEDLEEESQMLRSSLRHLAELQRGSGSESAVGMEVVGYALKTSMTIGDSGSGFLTGGVTFCAMLPMRSIPFKVIALVGMSGRAFPRSQRPAGFDFIASHPKPGDRSSREEDRYLFLEALLSARTKLYISYVGQSIKDNTELPPSVVVSELLEAVEQGFVLEPAGNGILDHVCLRHRLQAFSPVYFEGLSALFSYSEENLNALRARQAVMSSVKAARRPSDVSAIEPLETSIPTSVSRVSLGAEKDRSTNGQKSFISASIGEPPDELRQVDLRELHRFFRGPAAYFFRKRLGLRLDEDKELADGREPFSLNALDAYGLEQDLVARRLAGEDLAAAFPAVRSQGVLPAGVAGELIFQDAVLAAEDFALMLSPLLEGEPLAPVDVDVAVGGFRVTGRIGQLWSRHHLSYRCAAAKAKDRLSLWIDHLLLQQADLSGYPKQSVLAAKEGVWRFHSVPDAPAVLEQLLNHYWDGLQTPLPFFPQTAQRYAERRLQGRTEEDAAHAARKVWEGDNQSRGEREDPYYQLNWRKSDALDERFRALALEIFAPLLAHVEELKV